MEYFCLLSWILVASISQIRPLQLGQSGFSRAKLSTPNRDLVCDFFSIRLVQNDSKGDSICVHSCASGHKVHSRGILPWLAAAVVDHQRCRRTPHQMVLTRLPSAHWKKYLCHLIYFMIYRIFSHQSRKSSWYSMSAFSMLNSSIITEKSKVTFYLNNIVLPNLKFLNRVIRLSLIFWFFMAEML